MDRPGQLGEFVPYLLSITSNLVSQRIAQEYHSRFGLKVPEWRIMAVLGDTAQATQRDLAHLTYMDKVAVNRACKVLEERALVRRVPNDADGRSHLLELTETGARLYGEIMPLALGLEERLLDGLAPGERGLLIAILARLRATAEAQ